MLKPFHTLIIDNGFETVNNELPNAVTVLGIRLSFPTTFFP